MQETCTTNYRQPLNSENLAGPAKVGVKAWRLEQMGLLAVGRKRCARCGEILPVTEFHNKKGSLAGKSPTCRHCKYIVNKRYYSSKEGKIAVSNQTKRKWIRSKDKIKCRNAVNWAILDGKIKPCACSVCGSCFLTEAHHEDYSKPFEITWLCKRHHMERHGKKLSKQEREYGAIY